MRLFPTAASLMTLALAATVHAQDTSIRVGGSTTALPIISTCSAHFMEKHSSWDKADASLAKEQTVIYVTGGGSGFGVKGLQNGTIDVGMVSRDLKDSEIRTLGGPQARVFARDAVAIATSAANPLAKSKQSFTSAELAGIFSGQVAQFSQIDGNLPAKALVLVTRDASGGVTEIFQERVMKQQRLAASRLQFPSTAALIRKLETNDAAIAFVSAGAVAQDPQLRTYAVDGVAPSQENIANGSYSLNRPMLVVTRPNPPRKVQVFIDFVLGDCQATVKEMGFIPVSAPTRAVAKKDVGVTPLGDVVLKQATLAALAAAVILLALVVGFIAWESRIPPASDVSLWGFLFLDRWDPTGQPHRLGIGHAWMATLLIVGLALLLATPFAIAIGVFLSEVAPPFARAIAEPTLQLLAGVPAVVYGFVGYVTLVAFMEQWLPTGETVLCAALVLALMVVPFIAATAAESFMLVARELRLAGLALGASRWYVFSRITLRKAAPGVLAGVILGMGRGLGETLAVLMLSGNSPVFPDSLTGRGQPLTALIATDLGESAIHSERYYALFSAGLLLMASVIAINMCVGQLKRRLMHAA